MDFNRFGVTPMPDNIRSHSKLDSVIGPSDLLDDGTVSMEDLVKSPTKSRSETPHAGTLILGSGKENSVPPPPQTTTAVAVSDFSSFQFKQPIPVAPITTVTESDLRVLSTPVQLGKARPMDIPSSLEKFKSLKIGMKSLSGQPSGTASSVASPARQNPFSPKPVCAAVEQITAPIVVFNEEACREIIDMALNKFKAQVRNDIQNVHVELLRQFVQQQEEIRRTLQEYLPGVQDLLAELKRMRDENERLKLLLYK